MSSICCQEEQSVPIWSEGAFVRACTNIFVFMWSFVSKAIEQLTNCLNSYGSKDHRWLNTVIHLIYYRLWTYIMKTRSTMDCMNSLNPHCPDTVFHCFVMTALLKQWSWLWGKGRVKALSRVWNCSDPFVFVIGFFKKKNNILLDLHISIYLKLPSNIQKPLFSLWIVMITAEKFHPPLLSDLCFPWELTEFSNIHRLWEKSFYFWERDYT